MLTLLTFYVPRVEKVELFEGPALTIEGAREGKTAAWLRWKKRGFVKINPEKVLQSLPAPPVDWPGFWKKYGPLVKTEVWDWTKAILKGMLEEGWSCAPVNAAESAFNLLYSLRPQKGKTTVWNVEKVERTAAFLQEFYEYLQSLPDSDWVKQHAKPLKEILITAGKTGLEAAIRSDVPRWNKNYTLRVPFKGELAPSERKGWLFSGEARFTPRKGTAVLLPCIFPVLLDCILSKSPVLCACGCGQVVQPGCKYADPSHRKRVWWRKNRRG